MNSLMAVGKKLFLNRADLDLRLRYLRENRLWLGWEESWMTFWAFDRRRRLASVGDGVTPIVLSADGTSEHLHQHHR